MAGFQVIGDEEDDDVVRVFVMTTDYSMQVRNFIINYQNVLL